MLYCSICILINATVVKNFLLPNMLLRFQSWLEIEPIVCTFTLHSNTAIVSNLPSLSIVFIYQSSSFDS